MLFRSESVTVEALFNTRVCKSLQFVKDFSQVFKPIVEAEGVKNDTHSSLLKVLERYANLITLLLNKWQNFVTKMIFDDTSPDTEKEINKKLKKALKTANKRACRPPLNNKVPIPTPPP